MKMKFPSEFTLQLWVFYGEDDVNISTVPKWVRKSLGNDRNLDLNDQM